MCVCVCVCVYILLFYKGKEGEEKQKKIIKCLEKGRGNEIKKNDKEEKKDGKILRENLRKKQELWKYEKKEEKGRKLNE